MTVTLPLLSRTAERSPAFVLTPLGRTAGPACGSGTPVAARMPDRAPGPGEQYRFHFDMGTCIGCKCCVVACNEQNGNPPAINWRRVSEVEGGFYPAASRHYLSMGCNHCLEPTCLQGCPVDAYTKDAATGIVQHSADACIGCQYCTWNCSYGVPQYNAERGVVGKCDLCHGRLSHGQAPACVSACPEGAIRVEIVATDAWRAATGTAAAGVGYPVADHSVSSTRLTMPAGIAPDAKPVDLTRLSPAEPHWPLVVMTVLTQLAVGTLATVWVLGLLGRSSRLDVAALTALAVAALALGASTLHLGRPAHAYRALRMWRRSWLSREVLLFSAFSGVALAYGGALALSLPGSSALGAATVLLGVGGVTASACIYRVPSRPSWHSRYTPVHFLLTAAVLGPLAAGAVGAGDPRRLAGAVVAAGAAQLLVLGVRFLSLTASDQVELRASARLLSTDLAPTFLVRLALLVLGGLVVPMAAGGWAAMAAALALALAGELVGRYLFFVSAVPVHLTAPYLATGREA